MIHTANALRQTRRSRVPFRLWIPSAVSTTHVPGSGAPPVVAKPALTQSLVGALPGWIGAVSLCCATVVILASVGCGTQATEQPEAAAPVTDMRSLCERIDAVLEHARDGRQLNTTDHAAWQVVHGILAFGDKFRVMHEGETLSALEYLLSGGQLTGWTLRPGSVGVIAVRDPGSKTGQGHPDQWLGYLSQCDVGGIPLDTAISTGGKEYKVGDLLSQAQHDLRPGQEATWTLMGISTYLPIDTRWTAGDGTEWTVEKVVGMETAADLAESACGGTHRLYGLTVALNRYLSETGLSADELTDSWAGAHARIQESVELARRYQQADGSFSTGYFERPSTSPDVFAKIGSSGHTFEFLTAALEPERLNEPWMRRAADALVTLLEQTADVPVECGALYHAAHGLALYRARVCIGVGTADAADLTDAPRKEATLKSKS